VGALPPPDVREPLPRSAQITGLPRSGTTLLYQLFARTGAVGYPSNVMAMFHRVPWVGARLQVHLAASDPRISTRSIGGRTPEPLDPHEFGYFWRRVCGHSGNSLRQDLEPAPIESLQRSLDLVAAVFGMPVVYKNFLALTHGPRMLAELEGMHLFLVRRPERDVAASLIQLRRRLHTPDSAALGVEPEGLVQAGTVEDRVARQVVTLGRRLEVSGLAHMAGVETVDYEELCAAPRVVMSRLLAVLGCDPVDHGRLPDRLEPGSGFAGLGHEHQARLARALDLAKEETNTRG
jgi:hypothetical protein